VTGDAQPDNRRTLGALAALSLAVFAYVTTENLPIGLLPQLAHGLHHSRSVTGYLVTGYAAVVVIASVPLALATRRYSRRLLLIAALSVFVVGSALGAAAPSYSVLLATRMAIALSHAVFWAVVAAAGAALVPRERRGQALGLVFAGASLAGIIGVPVITWIGQQTSWRVSTLVASALGAVSLVAVWALVPAGSSSDEREAAAPHASARRYAATLCALGLAVMGAFALLTYITVFLTTLGGLPGGAISPILLLSGATGTLGVITASRFVTHRPWATMTAGVTGLGVTLLGLAALAHHGVADVLVFCLYGFSLSMLAIGVQNRVLDVAPGNLNVASAGNSAMFNVGIGGGALLGGLLLQGPGVRAIPLVGGVVVVAALAILVAEKRLLE
jgi:DHA1 family inner membrane transport protein